MGSRISAGGGTNRACAGDDESAGIAISARWRTRRRNSGVLAADNRPDPSGITVALDIARISQPWRNPRRRRFWVLRTWT